MTSIESDFFSLSAAMPMTTAETTEGCDMSLEKEMETYRAKLPQLLVDGNGKFVLIHCDEVEGTYDTYEDALKSGYEKFKLETFLVKQITAVEVVHCITRGASTCHT